MRIFFAIFILSLVAVLSIFGLRGSKSTKPPIEIFPDMDHQNIWYTDHFDLIELARNMGVGDETLPHWSTEANEYNRYLEINTADLVQILLDLAEEAAIDPYRAGGNVHRWFRYIARETLKSRKRTARYRQKQNESLWVSPKILGIEGWDKN